jgi:hypothetical protein
MSGVGEFPATSALTMCCGRSLGGAADGGEAERTIIFEMDLACVCVEGQREVPQKALLMDGVCGKHYVVKIFHAEEVVSEPGSDVGLRCHDLKPLMSWQFRPGLGLDTSAGTTRKRQLVEPDARDSQMRARERRFRLCVILMREERRFRLLMY